LGAAIGAMPGLMGPPEGRPGFLESMGSGMGAVGAVSGTGFGSGFSTESVFATEGAFAGTEEVVVFGPVEQAVNVMATRAMQNAIGIFFIGFCLRHLFIVVIFVFFA